jgi:hypothetical protein
MGAMRRVGFSLCFAAAAVMLIGAAPGKRQQVVIPPKPAAAKPARQTRPTSSAPTPQFLPNTAASLSGTALAASDASAIPPGPRQCRAGCAHSYYFCLSGSDADSCPQTWSSCLTDCSRDPIQPDAPAR